MKDRINIGYIGCGRRGFRVLSQALAYMDDITITMLCDLHPQRMEAAANALTEQGKPMPTMTDNYQDLLQSPDVDAIVIMTDWHSHKQLILDALMAGKPTAVEVGCTYDIRDCFDIIDVYERTGTPLMMLENCCYSRREMMALHMAAQGALGEIVHCTGGYHHNLLERELFFDIDNPVRHYRLDDYAQHNCEQYPTHELGPICKLLHINRGNRLVSLSSFSSKARGLKAYTEAHFPDDSEFRQMEFIQGDIVTTCITCAGGETIVLTLDTTLPRSHYSRNFTVRGTKGMISEEGRTVYLEGMPEQTGNEDEMYALWQHPLHREFATEEKKGTHNGMDWLVTRAFIESVKAGTNTPIDAYDTVTWMAIAALSEQSIRQNGAPVEVPDFTGGKWQNREPAAKGKYSLDY